MIREPKKSAGAGFKNLEFVRFNEMGDSIVRSVNSEGEYGDEIVIKRGLRGFTGDVTTKPDKPEPPFNVPYGTIVEWPKGAELPSGWIYTMGGTLSKQRYPHMYPILSLSPEPSGTETLIMSNLSDETYETNKLPTFATDNSLSYSKPLVDFYSKNGRLVSGWMATHYVTNFSINTNRNINYDSVATFMEPLHRALFTFGTRGNYTDNLSGGGFAKGLNYIANTNQVFSKSSCLDNDPKLTGCFSIYDYTSITVSGVAVYKPASVKVGGILSEKHIANIFRLRVNPNIKIGYIKINSQNALGNYKGKYISSLVHESIHSKIELDNDTAEYWDKLFVDGIHQNIEWNLVIEKWDDDTEQFIRVKTINNKRDFKKFNDEKHIYLFDETIIVTHLRFYIDFNISEYNFKIIPTEVASPFDYGRCIFFSGLEIGFYKEESEVIDTLSIPFEQDAEGNSKIIYIGQPVELVESSGGVLVRLIIRPSQPYNYYKEVA